MSVVYYRGTHEQARMLVYRLAAILTGRAHDEHGIASGFKACLGFAALSDVKDAFVTKSHGGTDEMGITWAPLSKAYLAYGRRFGKGEQTALKTAAGLNPRVHRFGIGDDTGLLTAAEKKRWKQIFARLLARLLLSMPEGAAKARAAQYAWAQIKREGAHTKLEVYGNRKVDIGRDSGVLLNSLSPGELSTIGPGAQYTRPTQDQVFDVTGAAIIVGTNVPYAAPFQKRRPFLPDDRHPVPASWWANWLRVGGQALRLGAVMLFTGGA